MRGGDNGCAIASAWSAAADVTLHRGDTLDLLRSMPGDVARQLRQLEPLLDEPPSIPATPPARRRLPER